MKDVVASEASGKSKGESLGTDKAMVDDDSTRGPDEYRYEMQTEGNV